VLTDALLDEASPPSTLPVPAAPPWAVGRPPSAAKAPPNGLTLWFERPPEPSPAATVPQALWYSVFEAHRDRILANARAMGDDALAQMSRALPGATTPLSEAGLLQSLLRERPLVTAAHPQTGALMVFPAEDLPIPLGVGFLRTWVQPQILPTFLREALEGNILPGAQEFFDYVLMELANGEHFFDISVTAGVPVYAIMRFVRAYADGDMQRLRRLQQALDDGVDVATAAFARAADDPSVSDEALDRAKQALVARRDLILRLQDSRYAPPAVATKNALRVSAGGMQIDFTFDTQAPLPSTKFHRHASTDLQVLDAVTPSPSPSAPAV
jgi:hypothetical protein